MVTRERWLSSGELVDLSTFSGGGTSALTEQVPFRVLAAAGSELYCCA